MLFFLSVFLYDWNMWGTKTSLYFTFYIFSLWLYFSHQWNTFPKLVAKKNKKKKITNIRKKKYDRVQSVQIDKTFEVEIRKELNRSRFMGERNTFQNNKQNPKRKFMSFKWQNASQNCGANYEIMHIEMPQSFWNNIRALSEPHYYYFFCVLFSVCRSNIRFNCRWILVIRRTLQKHRLAHTVKMKYSSDT